MKKDQAKINEFFSEHWIRLPYDLLWRPYDELICTDIKLHLPNADVLDVGCGYNLFKVHLPNVTGLDPAYGEVDVQSTIEEYVTDKRYDAIICSNMLHFGEMSEVEAQVDKIISLLKPKARMYLRLQTDFFPRASGEELVSDFRFVWSDEMLANEIERIRTKGLTCFRKGYNVEKSRYLAWFSRG